MSTASRHPMKKTDRKWAVGMLTASRRIPTIERSLASLVAAGFPEVIIFAEPHAGVKGIREKYQDVTVVRRPNVVAPLHPKMEFAPETTTEPGRFGCWQNHVQSLADLLEIYPDADTIMLVQDDVEFCKDVREFVDHDLWPSPRTGSVSLYTSRVHENEAIGCRFRGDAGRMGACCNIFPRKIVEELLASPRSHDWQGRPSPNKERVRWKKKAADTWFGRCFMQMGYRAYSYTPSPSQHFAKTSAVGHGGNTGKRSSSKFVGTEVSMFDLYERDDGVNYPRIRFDLPSGRRKYQEVTRKNRKRIRVGIPAVDSFDLTATAIEHIAANNWPVVIDYVDNGSKDTSIPNQVKALCKELELPHRITRWDTNRQFTPAVNHSLEEADRNNEFFLCLNNDCFVAPNCLERMFLALWSNPEVAAVGPFSCDRGHQSLRKEKRLKQAGLGATPKDPQDVAGIESLLKKNTTSTESMLAFFCTLISPKALHKVGPLPKDKEYESGLAADDVWCRAAIRRKMHCELVHDAYAHHAHSSTFRRLNIDRRSLQKVALAKYRGRR